jgi:hypothetical protein
MIKFTALNGLSPYSREKPSACDSPAAMDRRGRP